ncbi:hypothetical protein [Streptomyces sp. NPDC088785]|uniref:hypothetical protein n=1 Tax=Streptomyces sp. NPDC088785 TaxID=3365897 RepID=UPI003823225D
MTDIERERQARQSGLQHDPDARRDDAVAPDRDLTRGTDPDPNRDTTLDTGRDVPLGASAGTGTGRAPGTGTGVGTGAGTGAGTGTGTGPGRAAGTGTGTGLGPDEPRHTAGDRLTDTTLGAPGAPGAAPTTPPPPATAPAATPSRDKTVGPGADEPGPLVAGAKGHERSASPRHGDSHGHGSHGGLGTTGGARLFEAGAHDELSDRLRQAVTGFVDQPRAAVEEADHVLEDLTARLAETLAGHRRTLRTTWQESTDDTEQLRLALRDYRETAEKLLNL